MGKLGVGVVRITILLQYIVLLLHNKRPKNYFNLQQLFQSIKQSINRSINQSILMLGAATISYFQQCLKIHLIEQINENMFVFKYLVSPYRIFLNTARNELQENPHEIISPFTKITNFELTIQI